jgi:glyoxylase-like metal-dependent hydrolase (beta-lactamase superfamily II)
MRFLTSLLALSVLPPAAPSYQVDAIQYGVLTGFPVRALVAGADSTRRLDAALYVWLVRGEGRTILVDAGFHRPRFVDQWKPRDYRTPAEAVAAAGVTAEGVTDVVITHAHWDHLDGVGLFRRARVWIQREEYEFYRDPAHRANSGVFEEDMADLEEAEREGRLRLVDGDGVEILPGITVHTGGRHTRASQFVRVNRDGGAVVLASDNAYLYENLTGRRPIAQTWDSVSNVAAQARMLELAGRPDLVVPGHDPAVMARYRRVAAGVVRIE